MYHYQKNIGDYRSATQHLSLLEHGVYNQILDWYYLDETAIPLDNRTLFRRLSAKTEEEQQAVIDVLSEMFVRTDEGWKHKRVEREITQYRAKAQQAREAGKLGGRPRKNPIGSTDNRFGYEKKADAKPTANQEPITSNQEPKEEKTPRKRSAPPVFELPDWINREHWDAWHSCPKRRKATDSQKALAVAKLAAWRRNNEDFAGALENAAVGGWQGLFLQDAQKAGNQSFAQQAADVARTTVPSKSDRDPALVEIERHVANAAPIPQAIREKMAMLRRAA